MEHFLDCVDVKITRAVTDAREQRTPLLAVAAAYHSMKLGVPVDVAEVEPTSG